MNNAALNMGYRHLFWVLAFTFSAYIAQSGISKGSLSRQREGEVAGVNFLGAAVELQ